jgi:hypothetical protein
LVTGGVGEKWMEKGNQGGDAMEPQKKKRKKKRRRKEEEEEF